jgi:heterogeneous nuclear ribonucleoprotein F/H
VCVILNRDGRPSGDAIAEFETEDDMEEAMKKDRENLGSRFIVLTREKDVESQPR